MTTVIAPLPRTATTASPSRLRRLWPTDLPLILAALPLLLLFVLPLMALALRVSPAQFLAGVANPAVMQAIWISLVTSTAATTLAMLSGLPLAYLLARRQFRGRNVVDTLIDLPMVLPPSVAGIALLVAFGRRGLFGQYLDDAGVSIAFSQTAVILAQMFVAAPFFVKAAISALGGVDRELEQAAALDGAGDSQVFRHVTLPLSLPVLFAGAVMMWARALGEFGATIIFAGNFPGRTQTMPLAIYLGFELDMGVALTLALILLVVSFGVLFAVKRALRGRVGVG